jgi:hypothetical protein
VDRVETVDRMVDLSRLVEWVVIIHKGYRPVEWLEVPGTLQVTRTYLQDQDYLDTLI